MLSSIDKIKFVRFLVFEQVVFSITTFRGLTRTVTQIKILAMHKRENYHGHRNAFLPSPSPSQESKAISPTTHERVDFLLILVVDSNFCSSINRTWPCVSHQGFWFFPTLFLFFSLEPSHFYVFFKSFSPNPYTNL
ncbi:hypothetical protein AAZV13_03G044500 [Glycine max]